MSHEKSQLENINLPPQDGEAGNVPKKESSALRDGFSLGQQLITKDKPTPRSEILKYSLPDYQSGLDQASQEEKQIKARVEKEGMNYDLYLLIKDKLAGEFGSNLLKSRELFNNEVIYNLLKKTSLFDCIKKDPEICTPIEKDLIYIANNLNELLVKQNISKESNPEVGIFLNSFIHAYFNSVPEEKRKNLKLNLPNTKDLDFIGAELSFGELEVEDVGDYFGYQSGGFTILKAQKAGDNVGQEASGYAQILAEEAGDDLGFGALGSTILQVKKVGDFAGWGACENAQILVTEAGNCFAYQASGSAILKAGKVLDDAGEGAHGNAQILVEEAWNSVGKLMYGNAKIKIDKKYLSIGDDRKDNAQIILPDGRVLMPGDSD